MEPQHGHPRHRLFPRGPRGLSPDEGSGARRLDRVHRLEERLAASPGASAYCAAKAAEIHLARCLALEGAPLGIRVNMVNPDAVLRGSKIWPGEWRQQRAAANKVSEERARGGLPPALAAEALGLSRGHRRGGLFLRLATSRRNRPATSSMSTPATRRRSRGERRFWERPGSTGRGCPTRDQTGGASMSYRIPDALIAEHNAKRAAAHEDDYGALQRKLGARAASTSRRSPRKVAAFARRRPDLGRRHRRHALRPLSRPRRAARHLRQAGGLRDDPAAHARDADLLAAFPLGQGRDYRELRRARRGARPRLRRRQLQHLSGPARPAALLQVRLADPRRQRRARRRRSRTISNASRSAAKLGSKALTVWIGDGSNFPGQSNLNRVFDRYLESDAEIYAGLPADWRVFLEHKLYEPAFYSTVISDWGIEPDGGAGAGPQGALPRRPRPPRAQRQYRADRRAPDPRRQARRLPLQRFQIRRRRSRRRLDRPVPAVPGVQRTGRRGGRAARPASIPPT